MSTTIDLFHGSGAKKSYQLIHDIFFEAFDNPFLRNGADAVVLPRSLTSFVVTTDAFVVSPLFFPGGDLGKLAVCGPLNDLTAMGAQAKYLTVSFILEEGLEIEILKQIAESMGKEARAAQVSIVAGDTKVVERNKGDKIFISVTAIGHQEGPYSPHPQNLRPGQKIITSGTIGDHGATILAARKDLAFEGNLSSDCANLQPFILPLLKSFPTIRCMRDPTRGGVSGCLHELMASAREYPIGFRINEEDIPYSSSVRGLCEILGLDPLTMANEGKMLIFCDDDVAPSVVAHLRQHPQGGHAMIIGEVTDRPGVLEMRTLYGGTRSIIWSEGDSLPRIC